MATKQMGANQQVASLKRVATTPDGKHVSFSIQSGDGKNHDFFVASEALPNAVSFFARLSQWAAAKADPKTTEKRKVTAEVVQARDIRVMKGRTDQEALLIVDIGTFPIAFAISPDRLAVFRDTLNRVLEPVANGNVSNRPPQ